MFLVVWQIVGQFLFVIYVANIVYYLCKNNVNTLYLTFNNSNKHIFI